MDIVIAIIAPLIKKPEGMNRQEGFELGSG